MDKENLAKAIDLLAQGDVVGIPTETVYGLAARIDRPLGLQKIFKVKNRPFFDPLIVHVSSVQQAIDCTTDWNSLAQKLAQKFWPGPLTLVLKHSHRISALITSGLPTVALRSPDHPLALELIKKVGVPLAAPSANRFGKTSPTTAAHARSEFADSVFVLEGGPCQIGIESTIVRVNGTALKLLRPGQITEEQITQELTRQRVNFQWEKALEKREAPGQMKHHYMPDKPLIIFSQNLTEVVMREKILSRVGELPKEVEGVPLVQPKKIESLYLIKFSEDPVLAARELYQKLREAAEEPADILVLVWPPDKREGPWKAIWDRLKKAASLHFDSEIV